MDGMIDDAKPTSRATVPMFATGIILEIEVGKIPGRRSDIWRAVLYVIALIIVTASSEMSPSTNCGPKRSSEWHGVRSDKVVGLTRMCQPESKV